MKKLLMPSENAGCIPSAVVIMTTADGKHPAFSGRHPKLLTSDLYRVVTEIAEVHTDIARSFLKCIIPLYLLPSIYTTSSGETEPGLFVTYGHLQKTLFWLSAQFKNNLSYYL